jgi:hypothetical protein
MHPARSTNSRLFDDGWLLPIRDVESGLDWRWLTPEPSTRPSPSAALMQHEPRLPFAVTHNGARSVTP